MGVQHYVTLPHPNRSDPARTGTCACGWTVTYGWGGHDDATATAGEHIEQAGRAHPVVAREMSGQILVMEGRSL